MGFSNVPQKKPSYPQRNGVWGHIGCQGRGGPHQQWSCGEGTTEHPQYCSCFELRTGCATRGGEELQRVEEKERNGNGGGGCVVATAVGKAHGAVQEQRSDGLCRQG